MNGILRKPKNNVNSSFLIIVNIFRVLWAVVQITIWNLHYGPRAGLEPMLKATARKMRPYQSV